MKQIVLLLVPFIFHFTTLAAVSAPVNNGQMRAMQIMQNNQQILKTQDQINTKLQSKKDLEASLKEIESTLTLSRAFAMQSKIQMLNKDKARVQNDLQQTNLDVSELKKTQKILIEKQKTLNR